MADLRNIDIAAVTKGTGLSVSVQSDKEDLVYRDGYLAETGTSVPGAPHVDEQYVLSAVTTVRLTTSAGDVYLEEPELLRTFAPLLRAAASYARNVVYGGSPTAEVNVAMTETGELPGPSFSHDNHIGGYVKEEVLQTPAGAKRVRLFVCPDRSCRLVFVGV